MQSVCHVQEVDLVSAGIQLPPDLVGIVVMQPFLSLTREPFRCQSARKAEQIAALERTLEIAKTRDHGAEKTHFTVIPEYCIPGLDGIAAIETAMQDASWPGGTVVIGGTDALTKADYAQLCGAQETSVDGRNGVDRVHDSEWINCCITWVKTSGGELRRWLQPKLSPSWPEQNITHARMFRGGSVFVFRCAFANGVPCRFFSLVCFDWVGLVNGDTIPHRVLEELNARGQELSLSWIFVLEHNDQPSHSNFLSGVADFFENQARSPLVNRGRCSVIFANTAGGAMPGRVQRYGYTSVILSPLAPFDLRGCHPTYSGVPDIVRRSDALTRCKDVVFREMGACIHSFSQYVPAFANLGAAGRSLPIRWAAEHSIAPSIVDPRVNGNEISASVKWVNDALDFLPSLSEQFPRVPLAAAVEISHSANKASFRVVESLELRKVSSGLRGDLQT